MIMVNWLHLIQEHFMLKALIFLLFLYFFKTSAKTFWGAVISVALMLGFGLFLLIADHSEDGNDGGNGTLPVVMWHGMGDSCCLPFSLGAVKTLLQAHLNGTYVKSLEIGGNVVLDYESGFFIHPDKQIEYVCKELAKDRKLSEGYNAIGFSQGAQFLRAVSQRCPQPPMKVLISVGGQHQGVFGLPKCPSLAIATCEYIRKILNVAAYDKSIQEELVQATYWHDPLHDQDYRLKSTFLSNINNELEVNETYAENLNKLTKFVMIKFLNDTIVQPKESQWFEFYRTGQDKVILPLRQSQVYKGLGLDRMEKSNKLRFFEIEGDHLQIKNDWFIKNLIPLLRGPAENS